MDACLTGARRVPSPRSGSSEASYVGSGTHTATVLGRVPDPDLEVRHMKALDIITGILVIIGGLNWGLVALFEFDLVAEIFTLSFGQLNAATRTVYILVALSAIWQAVTLSMRAREPETASTRTQRR